MRIALVRRRRSPLAGAVAGLLGGLAGAWAMNVLSGIVSKIRGGASSGGDDATVKAASAIVRTVAHRGLTARQKEIAGPAVHYAMGGGSGALYGVLAELLPSAWLARGLSLGAALWLTADEIAVPAFRLSGPPTRYPASVHAQALASHLVYGLTTDLVRRVVLLAA